MTELRFDGRAAVITGAGRGVGREHALLLASRGCRIVVADYGADLEGKTGATSKGPADDVVAEIGAAGGEAVACYGSVAEEAGAKSMVEAAMDSFGRVDIVINNAGISDPDLFEDLDNEHFQRMLDVHYLGSVNVVRAAWGHMRKAGYGRIVNTTSEGAFGVHPMVTSYGGAKGAVFAFTRVLATEGPAYGIQVNAIAPRANTRLGSEESVVKVFNIPQVQHLQRMRPELVPPLAAWLAHESCAVNGEVFAVGGGQVARMALMTSKGIFSEDMTIEHVAENFDRIMDLADADLFAVNPEIRKNALKAAPALG
jgi:NAD(P)-dependent dehydrogenase (short-subunit alcohol dehydrogenase family)